MEDYKKKYEDALERCKKEFNFNNLAYSHEEIKQRLKRVFPELKESEGERMRKEIIHYLDREITLSYFGGDIATFKKWIAWLEKQGEQKANDIYPIFRVGDYIRNKKTGDKVLIEQLDIANKAYCYVCYDGAAVNHSDFPFSKQDEWELIGQKVVEQNHTDKIEPKFKVGDWVAYNRSDHSMEIIQVYDIRDGRYYFTDNVHFSWSIKECDEKSHLWTIQDAKDGDVLATHLSPEGDWIGIYKESVDILGFKTYCFLNGVGEFVINPNRCRNHGTHGLHPATKEQRDLLFQKMKEAGYEWDAEKKDLKKIGQKSTWSEEDEMMFTLCASSVKTRYNDGLLTCNEYEQASLWLKSLKERMKGE